MASGEAILPFVRSPGEIRSLIATEYAALAEYTEVCRHAVDGIFVIPSEKDQHRWLGTVALVGGMYDGGIFRFELNFRPRNLSLPQIVFHPPVFHPSVDPITGQFDLSERFSTWGSGDRLRHALEYVKQSFLEPNAEGAKNPEAAALLRQSRVDYRSRISQEDIAASLQDFASDSNASVSSKLSFGPWIPELLEPEMQKMLESGTKVLDSRR